MCDLYDDDGEAPKVWTEQGRTARKGHVCDTCRGPIKPGERYVSHRSMTDGIWSSEKICLSCDEDRQKFADVDGHYIPVPSYFDDALTQCIEYSESPKEAEPWEAMRTRLRTKRWEQVYGRPYPTDQ